MFVALWALPDLWDQMEICVLAKRVMLGQEDLLVHEAPQDRPVHEGQLDQLVAGERQDLEGQVVCRDLLDHVAQLVHEDLQVQREVLQESANNSSFDANLIQILTNVTPFNPICKREVVIRIAY